MIIMQYETHYFRLKMVNVDNTYSFSNIISAACISPDARDLRIFPNPVKKDGILFFSRPVVDCTMYNMYGQKVFAINALTSSIPVTAFPSGMYYLTSGAYAYKIVIE